MWDYPGVETASFGRRKARPSRAPAVSSFRRGEKSCVGQLVIPDSDYPYWNCPLSDAWIRFSTGKWHMDYHAAKADADRYAEKLKSEGPRGPIVLQFGPATGLPKPRERLQKQFIKSSRRANELERDVKDQTRRRLASGELVAFGRVTPLAPGAAPFQIDGWWWSDRLTKIDWDGSAVSLHGAKLVNVRVYFQVELELFARETAREAEHQEPQSSKSGTNISRAALDKLYDEKVGGRLEHPRGREAVMAILRPALEQLGKTASVKLLLDLIKKRGDLHPTSGRPKKKLDK